MEFLDLLNEYNFVKSCTLTSLVSGCHSVVTNSHGGALICAGTSTDLVPTLLGMYDALIGRSSQAAERSMEETRVGVVTSGVSRPLSISSIASSSSSSSGTSSCSGGGGRRLGAAPKSSAYLASIESLEDDSDDPEAGGGGGGGGGCGKQRLHHQKPISSRAERLKSGSGGSQGQYTPNC